MVSAGILTYTEELCFRNLTNFVWAAESGQAIGGLPLVWGSDQLRTT